MTTFQYLLVALLLISTTTSASLLRQRSSVRRRSRPLFTGANALATASDIDNSVQTLLSQTLLREETKVSLTDNLGGVNLIKADGPCALSGKVMFTTQKVSGLEDSTVDSLELIKDGYQEISDSSYQWNGVYKVRVTLDAFKMDVTSQVDVNACGTPLDFTAFGGVNVKQAVVEATVKVEGQLSKDLSEFQLESAEVLSQQVTFDSAAHMGGLSKKLPLNYEGELHSLVDYFFAQKVQQLAVSLSSEA